MILIIEAVIAGLLSAAIMAQHRVSGLTSTFGGSGSVVVQRRGAEKVLFKATIWLAVFFIALALLQLVLGA
jgi:protein translocase SecG subunit